jgi:TetR/AcrR family transcriptional regulator, ethionamide resistance regulator
VFAEHGPVLRALADAATDDPDVEDAYGHLVQGFIDVTARHIEAEIAADRILALDPHETAKALILMNERYLNLSLAREPKTPRETVVETLSTIWTRTLYGRT